MIFINCTLWIDESFFSREGMFNNHNWHYWSENNPYQGVDHVTFSLKERWKVSRDLYDHVQPETYYNSSRRSENYKNEQTSLGVNQWNCKYSSKFDLFSLHFKNRVIKTRGHKKVATLFFRFRNACLPSDWFLIYRSISKNQSFGEQVAFRNPSKKKCCNLFVTSMYDSAGPLGLLRFLKRGKNYGNDRIYWNIYNFID